MKRVVVVGGSPGRVSPEGVAVLDEHRLHRGESATAVAVDHRLPGSELKRLGAAVPTPAPART